MTRTLAILVFVLLLLAGSASPVAAQVATPPATPLGTECRHPELPPGTPTPLNIATTPEGGMESAATPAEEAVEGAVATPPPDEGEPADPATIARVLEAELNLFHCFNIGDLLGAAALFTPEALQENLGVTNPYDLPGLIGEDDTQTLLLEIRDVRVLPDGRIRYQDRYQFGDTIFTDLNYLVERDGFLLLAKTFPLTQEPVAAATPSA